MGTTATILKAWSNHNALRPFKLDGEILSALMPPGGDWTVKATDGAITRSIYFGQIEAAQVNPQGSLDDVTEGQVAMGMCAAPVADAALRVIQTLANDPANLSLIAQIAETAVAYIERPAPKLAEPEKDEQDERPCI